MSIVILDMAISLDGYIGGRTDEDPGLHDWYFAPSGHAVAVIDELVHNTGAMILGRGAFGDDPNGFDTPYKVPHFVLTHEAWPTVARDGTSFRFVGDGIESALAQAQAAAGEKLVCVAGGAATAQQFLQAGLIDELQLHVVPKILGNGQRLFDQGAPIQLEQMRVLESPGVTHLRYRVVKQNELYSRSQEPE